MGLAAKMFDMETIDNWHAQRILTKVCEKHQACMWVIIEVCTWGIHRSWGGAPGCFETQSWLIAYAHREQKQNA